MASAKPVANGTKNMSKQSFFKEKMVAKFFKVARGSATYKQNDFNLLNDEKRSESLLVFSNTIFTRLIFF